MMCSSKSLRHKLFIMMQCASEIRSVSRQIRIGQLIVIVSGVLWRTILEREMVLSLFTYSRMTEDVSEMVI